MKVTNIVNIDLSIRQNIPFVDAVQGDSARSIEFRLFDKGQPFNVPSSSLVLIRYKRSDGVGGVYDTMPNGEKAFSVQNNSVTVLLSPTALGVPGNTDFQIAVSDDGELVSAFALQIRVDADPSADAVDAEEYVNIGNWLIPQMQELTNAAESAAQRAENAAEDVACKVTDYGAKGDGSTDDTQAFLDALANNRDVYVPGGTYILSDNIHIGANCGLTLDQNTVIKFTQTSKNCITLDMSSSLRGNHATVQVPYDFNASVICADSTQDSPQSEVPPFTRWDPMWKTGRYLTDLNIVKPDSRGFHYSIDGKCTGSAVYISADDNADAKYIWGLNFSGLRIAGGFNYGVRAINYNGGWTHEMRIDAFIDACEIGVSLVDCNCAYVSAIVQPRRAYTLDETYLPYAKHGIELVRSTNADLSGSRVWDWNATNSLWTPGGEYQHISMIGECRGLILNDFLYYEQSSSDIRELIYTDTPSNLEKMTILQEPITRWFKPKDGEPYFYDGYTERRVCLTEDLDKHFQTSEIAKFTDRLATAKNKDGSVFNDVGYLRNGQIWDYSGNLVDNDKHGCTGLFPCKQGDVIRVKDLSFEYGDDNDRVLFFDANFNVVRFVNRAALIGGGSYYAGYEETESGFIVRPKAGLDSAVYAAFNISTGDFGKSPVIAVNEEIQYAYEGFLGEGIKVRGKDVILTSSGGKSFLLSVSDNGTLSTVAYQE